MRRQPTHKVRNTEILHEIVQTYIETGEPVASRTIATQPHTSAGRVPTEKAFQSYVRSLGMQKLLANELARLRVELGRFGTLPARMERSSHMLMEMTRGVGIAAAIPPRSQMLDQVDLLLLSDRRVLMVVVTRDQSVHNRVVTLDEPVSQDELNSIRNYVNWNFTGWDLYRIQHEVEERLRRESATYDAILRSLQALYLRGLLDIDIGPEIHLEGASNLVGLDLHLTAEKMRELFRALEEKKKLLLLIECFLDEPAGEIGVHVGLSKAHPSMGELSLIGISVPLPSGMSGKIAVLGPMRMNYGRVISAVVHMGHALRSTPV
ncbi:MAG: heat-inducible transcription repressor HrcA [Acidobacteria bacterium]|nr:heat-inducible transcription repressor HrcA [Acidobacteriota bacterium]